VSATRLFILGSLARCGPLHGHGIRLRAQTDRTELWSDIKPGSLYGALSRMADEGLIEVVCTQREGKLPERTVYGITDKGRRELAALRAAVLSDVRFRPDPVDVALAYADDMPVEELRAAVLERRNALAKQLESWRALYEEAAPHLKGLEPCMFRHTFARVEAEVVWHDGLLEQLTKGKA
jgi:DNA-binding PadR family transcriptional regulator